MTTREQPIYGVPCWIDLSTSDKPRALAFYGGLFDWTATESGEEFGYYSTVSKGDAEVGGMMQKSPEMGDCPISGASISRWRMSRRRSGMPSPSARNVFAADADRRYGDHGPYA